ncbi:MAG: hypothetical protein E7675_03990 [Ruminococcaceae bacterium]|nr:hypothetical protein [Oscillospiraceae bacterium]
MNLSENILSFKKHLFWRVLMYTVLLPMGCSLVFGGIELIVVYFSNLYDSAFGIIMAQIISILGDVLTFCCLILGYCSSGAYQMSFGSSSSKKVFALLLASPIAATAASLLIFYILVAVGWHDYSLRMFFEYLPVFLINAGFSAVISTLVSVVVFVSFYLSGPMRKSYTSDPRYRFTVKLIMAILIIIKAVSLGVDIALYDGGYSSVNNIIGGIVFPILYEVLEVFAAIFAIKKFTANLSEKAESYGIKFE